MGEPWPEKPSADYVRERVCQLVSDVWNNNFTSETANDCFCGAGGLWDSSGYGGTYENGFRHGGEAVMWLERVAEAMQGIPDPAKFIVDMQLAFQALRRGPELNMSNYRADDVAELNANATEAYLLMRPYLEAVVAKQALAAKPADPPKDTKCD